MNCWEFMKCGREAGGANAERLGVCPAYPDHGTHCAVIAGTLCGGVVQGTFAAKISSCLKCDFLRRVAYDQLPVLNDAEARSEDPRDDA